MDEDDCGEKALEAFQINALRILETISAWTSKNSKTIVSQLETLEPLPPDDWTPRQTEGRKDFRKLFEHFVSSTASSPSGLGLFLSRLFAAVGGAEETLGRTEGANRPMTEKFKNTLDSLGGVFTKRETPSDTPRITPDWIAPQNQERSEVINEAKHVWLIEIRFDNAEPSPTSVGHTLWSLGSALESVPGVAVVIDSWRTGSLLTKLLVFMRNLWARDEVREVLHKGRDAAVSHYLKKPVEESSKLRAEREKIEEEQRLLKQQRESNSPEGQQELLALQIKEKREAIRAQQLDNSLKAIEVVERASDLVKSGLISADKVSVDINGLCYFLFDGEHIDRGEDVKVIESKGEMIGEDDVPDVERETPSDRDTE